MTFAKARDYYDGRLRSDTQALSHLKHLEANLRWPPNGAEIQAYIDWCQEPPRLAASTINTRLSILRKCFKLGGLPFPDERLTMPVRSKRPKWVMPEESENRFFSYLGSLQSSEVLRFCLLTGLRIEEALRLTTDMFIQGPPPRLDVPGTKTDGSAAVIPISDEAYRFATGNQPVSRFMWTVPYESVLLEFNRAKGHMGWTDPTCTPKAMRRTFAWRLLQKGTPVDVIQTLLRHANLATTSEYLNAVGKVERAAEYLVGVDVAAPSKDTATLYYRDENGNFIPVKVGA